MIGTTLGNYLITAKLGEGGMGEVWRATDSQLKREVAIKVLPAAFTEDKDRLARFEREAQFLAQLHHPNIASIFGLEVSGGARALVMELVEGPTLADRLSHGALATEEALAIARQIAGALEAAHEKGIVHRDLKPQNIKVAFDGTVKVLDFGLAKAMDSPSPGADLSRSPTLMNSPTLTAAGTQLGMILGTAAYMAPEQARGGAVDKRADIWAFGVVLYEMLTGHSLFAGETVTDTLAGVLKAEIDFTKLPREVPASIRALLRRCLERNPKNRLRDIGDARLVLEEALVGGGAGEAQPAGPRTVPWRMTVVLGALAAGFALLFVASLFQRQGRPAPVPESGVVRFPLVSDPGLFVYTELTTPFAVAPDGRTIVFVAARGGPPIRLYARALDDSRPRLLEGTEGALQPAISPDGEWVAFLVRATSIRKVRLRGGTPLDVATIGGVSASVAWASADELLFEVIGEDAGIHRVSAAGGTPAELIQLDKAAGETRQRRPFVLREERIVVYASTTEDGRTTLALYALADGRRARLELEGVQALGMVDGRLVYTREDGNLMAVPLDLDEMKTTGTPVELPERVESSIVGTRAALSGAGTLVYRPGSRAARLVLVDTEGRSRPLSAQEGLFESPRFSPDGRRIAVGIGASAGASGPNAAQDLWLFDRDTGEATRLTRTGAASLPEWTPDGNRLVYISRPPSKRGEIWTLPLDGSAEASRLIEIEGEPLQAVPAPDGRTVVAVVDLADSPSNELWRIPLDGSAQPTPLAGPSNPGSARRPIMPRVSRDGRFVAFGDRSNWEIFVRPMEGAGTLQVSDDGGWAPAWGPDGLQVFYGNGTQIELVDLRAGPSLAVAKRRVAVTLPHMAEEFDVAPDGKSFVVVAPAVAGSDVQVAVHWSDELRRQWSTAPRAAARP